MRPWHLLTLLALAAPATVHANWPAGGVPLGDTPPLSLGSVFAMPDGEQGLLLAGLDYTSGSPVHFHHVLATGNYAAGFDSLGVNAIAPNLVDELDAVVSDHLGGAWIAWVGCAAKGPCGPSSLRLLHVDGSGLPVAGMDPAGVIVRSSAPLLSSQLVADDLGGVIVAWSEFSVSANYDVYALGFDAQGVRRATPVAPAFGLPVCTATGDQRLFAVCSDQSRGAYLAWNDTRAGGAERPYYAMRVDSTGARILPWVLDGIRITPLVGSQQLMSFVPDGAKGFFLAWSELQDYPYYPLYLQRVSKVGAKLFGSGNGIPVSDSTGGASSVQVLPAPNDEVFVLWSQGDLRIQRIDASGLLFWPQTRGRTFGPATIVTSLFAANDAGGGVRAFYSTINGGQFDVYTVQLDVNAAQLPGQPAGGFPVATELGDKFPLAMIATPSNTPLIVWQAPSTLLRASRLILPMASVGAPSAGHRVSLRLLSPNPSPRGGALRVGFTLPATGDATFELFDVSGRRLASRSFAGGLAGERTLTVDETRLLTPGVYLARLTQGGQVATARWVRID